MSLCSNSGSVSLLFVILCFAYQSRLCRSELCIIFKSLESTTYSGKSIYTLSAWGTEYFDQNEKTHATADWVPNDPRRHTENGFDFFVHIDNTQLPSNLNKTQVITAITNAVDTWDNVACSQNKFNLLISHEYNGEDIGYAEYKLSGGQSGSNVKI
eukprot:743987_1